MEDLRFVKAMAKGQHSTEFGLEKSSYCIFTAKNNAEIKTDAITGGTDSLLLELIYIEAGLPGYLRIRQVETNALIEESDPGLFLSYLEDKTVKYFGQLVMYAIKFKMENVSRQIDTCVEEMKSLEDELDNCIDNSGTYKILDFRRAYTSYGDSMINIKEILTHINKGYFPIQMQNSYVLQGEVNLDFEFLERRYELIKNTLIKDLDTYTSIINNNINRNTRLLSIISLVGVVLNFVFGSIITVYPVVGIVGGVVIGGLSVGATFVYRHSGRNNLKPGIHHILPLKKPDETKLTLYSDKTNESHGI